MSQNDVDIIEVQRKQLSTAMILALSELGGRATQESLIPLIKEMLEDLPDMRNLASNVNDLIAEMISSGHLKQENGMICLASTPGSQSTR